MLSINHSSIVVPAAKRDELVAFLVSAFGHLGMTTRGPNFWVRSLPQSSADEEPLRVALKATHIAFAAQSKPSTPLCRG